MNVSPAFTLGVTRLRQLRSLPRRQREIRQIIRAEATRMDQKGALQVRICGTWDVWDERKRHRGVSRVFSSAGSAHVCFFLVWRRVGVGPIALHRQDGHPVRARSRTPPMRPEQCFLHAGMSQ